MPRERRPRPQITHLRLAVAVAGAAVALFTVARAGGWPRVLYLLSVGYLAYFAAGSAWRGLWQVAAAAPTDGMAETLAVTLELAGRIIARRSPTDGKRSRLRRPMTSR